MSLAHILGVLMVMLLMVNGFHGDVYRNKEILSGDVQHTIGSQSNTK